MVSTFFREATDLSQQKDFILEDTKDCSQLNGKLNILSKLLASIKSHIVSQLTTEEHVVNFRVLIFCQTKENAQKVQSYLAKSNWASQQLHGELCGQERKWVLHQYKIGDKPILVSTQIVITEGPDKNLASTSIVIFFDTPKNISQFECLAQQAYLHTFSLASKFDEIYPNLIKKLSQIRL